MKKRFSLILSLSLLCLTCLAQISTKQQPRSFKLNGVKFSPNNTIVLSSPDVRELLFEEEQKNDLFKQRSCAVVIPMEENFFNRAEKISLSDADLYLLKVKSEGALALNFYSNDFYLPQGGEFYIWNTSKTKCLGAFTSDNNSSDGMFATDYVYDDEMILEYYQPKSVKETAKINIGSIGYFYRDVFNFEQKKALIEDFDETVLSVQNLPYKDYRESGSCNVNVNCSEGDNFRDVQRSVVRMLIYTSAALYWCSGTLVNNTDNDRKPYIFSAAHCIEHVDRNSYYSQIVFYFNYETSGCNNPTKEPSYSTLTGCTRLSYDSKYGEGGTDYLLLELKNNVPQSYNPYWAGWSSKDELFRGCVSIHHPSGDVKKISTVDGAIQDMGYDENYWDYDTHRMTKWKKTANGYGITEGGSSGSGLFNADGLLIGSLSGGESSCYASDNNKVDWYGRMDVTFPKIKQWLDPQNTGCSDFAGREYTVGLEQCDKESFEMDIYPIPATDNINISLKNMNNNGIITILDGLGRSVYSKEIFAGTNTYCINIENFVKGVYYVRIYSKGDSIIKKIIVR